MSLKDSVTKQEQTLPEPQRMGWAERFAGAPSAITYLPPRDGSTLIVTPKLLPYEFKISPAPVIYPNTPPIVTPAVALSTFRVATLLQ